MPRESCAVSFKMNEMNSSIQKLKLIGFDSSVSRRRACDVGMGSNIIQFRAPVCRKPFFFEKFRFRCNLHLFIPLFQVKWFNLMENIRYAYTTVAVRSSNPHHIICVCIWSSTFAICMRRINMMPLYHFSIKMKNNARAREKKTWMLFWMKRVNIWLRATNVEIPLCSATHMLGGGHVETEKTRPFIIQYYSYCELNIYTLLTGRKKKSGGNVEGIKAKNKNHCYPFGFGGCFVTISC